MVTGIYIGLIAIVLVMWVWSIFMQRDLTINSVTLKAGNALSIIFAILVGIGASVIIASNFLPVDTWKIFILLILMMIVSLGVMWLTASLVQAIVSHKIPQSYRIGKQTRETVYLIVSVIVSAMVIGSMLTVGDATTTILIFIFTPIVVIIERTIAIKLRIKEITKFDAYTEEEISKAEKNFDKAIKEGKVLKPRENLLAKKVKKQREQNKRMQEYNRSIRNSEEMVKTAKKNSKKLDKEDKNKRNKKEVDNK